MKTNKTESMRVSITPEQRKALQEVAQQRDVSVATVVRWAVAEYLKAVHA